MLTHVLKDPLQIHVIKNENLTLKKLYVCNYKIKYH